MEITLVEKYVGEPVKDPFGRIVGTLVSVYSNVDGEVEAVELAVGGNKFTRIPSERLSKKGEEVVVLPEWMAEAKSIYRKMDTAIRRIKALETMMSNSEVNKDIVIEMKKKMEQQLQSLKGKLGDVKKMLRERIGELEDQILEMDRALINLQMSYMAGEISDKRYQQAASAIRHQKEMAYEEKKSVKEWIEKLEKLEKPTEESEGVQNVHHQVSQPSVPPIMLDLSD
ncbi:hypothetical protein EYM_01520 [Ignicoccus islandicus DSM 13165]|uniref:CdvA-like coiled-coil domain-containing protein n=1 Tax=Ignicoccus islandicus DSM 13165 TaxID=940295 RepID=A0A0U3F871_9CREN|nr:CdvA-like protein [Ignicoccus islandicus]ALU12216.1 hypothetical protein EYM_01520 [Ignicoccus islandicus DSM 13165]